MKRKDVSPSSSLEDGKDEIIKTPIKARTTTVKRRKKMASTTYNINSLAEEQVIKRRKIPLASEIFSDIIKREMIYVDKTDIIHNLLEEKSQAMLIARPRKFGKSLVIDIISHGLYI